MNKLLPFNECNKNDPRPQSKCIHVSGTNKQTIWTKNYLLHASIVMLKHSATRKTALTNAPRTSARAHPNVFLDHFFGDIYSRAKRKFRIKKRVTECRVRVVTSPLQIKMIWSAPLYRPACENCLQQGTWNLWCSRQWFPQRRTFQSTPSYWLGDIFSP